MSWLKENWFKIAILIVAIVTVVLAFMYENNQQEIAKRQQLAEFNMDCQKLATQKKIDLTENNSDSEGLYLNIYEYNYNPEYGACLLAYTGDYIGSALDELLGHSIFEIDNLSTGESLFSERVNPGPNYSEKNAAFQKMKEQYIGSTTSIIGSGY